MRGYQNYHGKKNGRRTARIVLLILVVALCAGYLLLQNYIVYNSDGSVVLDLPFLRGGETPPARDGEEGAMDIEILPPEDPGRDADQEGFSVAEESLYALWEDGDPAPPASCRGLVCEMKGETGVFYYQSALAAEGAVDSRAVSRSGVSELLSGERDWSAVAAIHCLRDDFYALSDMEGAGICQSTGYIWFGVDNSHWLEPAKPGAREYLCGVAAECRDMGFDEVLLRSLAYPTQGNLYKIDSSGLELSREEALEALVREIREALGQETLLSVELPAAQLLSGGESGAGVDPARILPLVDRLYLTGAEEAQRETLEAAAAAFLDGEVPAGFLVLETQ